MVEQHLEAAFFEDSHTDFQVTWPREARVTGQNDLRSPELFAKVLRFRASQSLRVFEAQRVRGRTDIVGPEHAQVEVDRHILDMVF